MSSRSMKEALGPLAAKMSPVVREHEILRVVGTIVGTDRDDCADRARNEVLRWAENRCGGRFPPEAWSFESFEYLSGGRDTLVVQIVTESSKLWSMRADDPDKTVPGRVWTNEVTIAHVEDQPIKFSARQLVSTNEDELQVEPHVPGFIRQIADNCGLLRGSYSLDSDASLIKDEADLQLLLSEIFDAHRQIPIFVLTVPDNAQSWDRPLINPNILSPAVLGLAKVVIVPDRYTYPMTDVLGKKRSVFGGAVRVYLPGFDNSSNPYDHRLLLPNQIADGKGAGHAIRWMRSLAARESLRHSIIGKDIVAFSAIRNASLQIRQQQLTDAGAEPGELLQASEARISALEKQVAEERASQDYYVSEHDRAIERASAAEEQLRASTYRIQQLTDSLRASDKASDADVALPESWEDFAGWADVALAGRLVLTPAARRQTRSPFFEDVLLAARCLLWLATECRDRRINGGGSLRDEPVESGVRNALCGSDEFDFYWQGQQLTAECHVKNGGNTRDPQRCLRIYYGWDESTKQIVVAEMPAHRHTGAS